MPFFDELKDQTAAARRLLLASAVIVDCLDERVSVQSYSAFLVQAFHHVRHTVPLLMACGSRLPERLDWLQEYVVEYIAEEHGHEAWIKDDLRATAEPGAMALLEAHPAVATELMVSYAYDTVARGNPVGLFGMVYVLEGTSVTIATKAADIIQNQLDLPDGALRYLRSHGALDQEHITTFEEIMNRFDDTEDRAAVLHAARVFFRLYADVFDCLPRADSQSGAEREREVA